MHGEASQRKPGPSADRVEMILRELEALPTLDSVVVRLLELTNDPESDAKEVIAVVESDPALASRVLAMCRCHERGRASNVSTIDRAVLLMGYEAVRCAALSVQVFEVFDGAAGPGGEIAPETPVMDREAFWLHALGVAVLASRLTERGTLTSDINPNEAFIAGLLHDIGALALHVLLPESFDQVCRIAETHSASLDRACRRIIGLDTHTAGKRLAEHWGLPPALTDVIWLHGQPAEALPPVPHRQLIALVSLADALVRHHYITPGAHQSRNEDLNTLCIPLGIQPDELPSIAADLHQEVTARAKALGLDVEHNPRVLLGAICRANASLARANAGMRLREQLAHRQARALAAITDFCASITMGGPLVDVIARVARSAAGAFESGLAAAVYDAGDGHGWRLMRFGADGEPFGCRLVSPPDDALPFESIVLDMHSLAPASGLLAWMDDLLGAESDLEDLQAFPLAGTGAAVLLLLENPRHRIDDQEAFQGLLHAWRAALVTGAQQDHAAHTAEQLAEANRALVEMQETLSVSQTMATLGEVAAGAAHEMNNPLTVISGRGQLLVNRLHDGELNRMAREVVNEAHRLSDMITALRSFAEPIAPVIRPVDLADVVVRAVQHYGPGQRRQPQVNTIFTEALPPVHIDAELVAAALGELVRNAVESKGSRHIELRVQTDPLDDRLRIEVRDDGSGLSEHALKHAFDPFFSEKAAGRQPGLGLATARRNIEAHGGRITLVNGPSGGGIATIWLAGWRAGACDHRAAA
jgi:signal transduction histidine kinase/HD-like signal output (HDOD) protein